MNDDEILTAEDVAGLLILNVDYVGKRSREGVIPCHRLPGGADVPLLPRRGPRWLRTLPVGDAGRDIR